MSDQSTKTSEQRPGSSSPGRLTRRRLLQRGLAIASACAVGEGLTEQHRLSISRHVVPMSGLERPLRVAFLTDLHCSWAVSEAFLTGVVSRTNAENPDLVVLTGDFVTCSSAYAAPCARTVAGLRARLGLFAVPGNHDIWCDRGSGRERVLGALRRAGIATLTNTNTRLENGLRLVGLDDSMAGHPDQTAAWRGISSDGPTLALFHNPVQIDALHGRDCLALAGHTHGGQLYVPGLVPWLRHADFPYLRGWFTRSDGQARQTRRVPLTRGIRMYVSRGIGTVGLPCRFLSPPEIAFFDLTPCENTDAQAAPRAS